MITKQIIELMKKDFNDKELSHLKELNEMGFISNEELKNIYNLTK
tara:strand:+ start:297 stop:431 length:135 start_codon:yes stop_codon:yes gene_type:complete